MKARSSPDSPRSPPLNRRSEKERSPVQRFGRVAVIDRRAIRVDVGWTAYVHAYGVAVALTLDEFALWLNLRDVYWEREGRESVEAIALFAGLLGVGIFGGSFFRGIGKEATKLVSSHNRRT